MRNTLEELKEVLSYEGCDCEPEYKPTLHIFNGVCSVHGGRMLINGRSVAFHKALVAAEARRLERHKPKVSIWRRVKNFFGIK